MCCSFNIGVNTRKYLPVNIYLLGVQQVHEMDTPEGYAELALDMSCRNNCIPE